MFLDRNRIMRVFRTIISKINIKICTIALNYNVIP